MLLLQALDLEGFAVSSGSACSSGSLEPSHVLTAMRVSSGLARSALRLSMGWATQPSDVKQFLDRLPAILQQVRAVTA